MTAMRCAACDGTGDVGRDCHERQWDPCPTCAGAGELTAENVERLRDVATVASDLLVELGERGYESPALESLARALDELGRT